MATASPVIVRRIRPHEATALRDIRLAALQDSPFAFARTLAEERAYPMAAWAERAVGAAAGETSATFVAETDSGWVGLVGAHRATSADAVVELVSMWVAPAARGRGTARRLVDAVLTWAAGVGAAEVQLWVTVDNAAAELLYRAMGFVDAPGHQPLPSDPCRDEQRMRRTFSGTRRASTP